MNSRRQPFWLPASNYYVMAAAVCAAFFFLLWGILHDTGDEAPWVTAGISSSMLLCGAVILREVILRRAQSRLVRERREMDARYAKPPSRATYGRASSKLTLERNAAILDEIHRKSEAARVLNKLSAGHREVFELCSDYIHYNESELKNVSAGSPRLAALLKGRSSAAETHRFHLLRWAEIEVTNLTHEAQNRVHLDEKIEAANAALDVIEESLESYPSETSLLQSKALLQDLLVSIRVSDSIEKAERAAFEHEYSLARTLYRDALFDLGRDNVHSAAREQAAKRINEEIERIREIETGS